MARTACAITSLPMPSPRITAMRLLSASGLTAQKHNTRDALLFALRHERRHAVFALLAIRPVLRVVIGVRNPEHQRAHVSRRGRLEIVDALELERDHLRIAAGGSHERR